MAIDVQWISQQLGVGVAALSHAAARAEVDHSRRLRHIGSKRRILDVPSPSLKALQRALYRRVLLAIPVATCVHSQRGYGVVSNARAHLGRPYVVIHDLRDAFPNVSWQQVRDALLAANFDAHAAGLVTRLCTVAGRLPQGPPTSPALLNLVLAPLDSVLETAARTQGVVYTRYVDDMSISSREDLSGFSRSLVNSVERLGFQLNERKTRRFHSGQLVVITGVVVARGLSAERDFLRELATEVRLAARGRSTLSDDQLRGRVAWAEQFDPRLGKGLRVSVRRAMQNRKAAVQRRALSAT